MPKAPPPYPPEFREEAVRLVQSSGKRVFEIAKDLDVSCETLRTWVERDQLENVNTLALTMAERDAPQASSREQDLA